MSVERPVTIVVFNRDTDAAPANFENNSGWGTILGLRS